MQNRQNQILLINKYYKMNFMENFLFACIPRGYPHNWAVEVVPQTIKKSINNPIVNEVKGVKQIFVRQLEVAFCGYENQLCCTCNILNICSLSDHTPHRRQSGACDATREMTFTESFMRFYKTYNIPIESWYYSEKNPKSRTKISFFSPTFWFEIRSTAIENCWDSIR